MTLKQLRESLSALNSEAQQLEQAIAEYEERERLEEAITMAGVRVASLRHRATQLKEKAEMKLVSCAKQERGA